MERKICTHCNIEKNKEDSHNNYTECEFCNGNRSVKRHYENKDKISNQKN